MLQSKPIVGFPRLCMWLVGASPEMLVGCPQSEIIKQVALGATLLIPATFSFIASSYAVHSLRAPWWLYVPIAFVWALIILTIDRYLVASYRSRFGTGFKVLQFILRGGIALFLGIVISHPVTLMIFKDAIQAEFARNKPAMIEVVKGLHEQRLQVLVGMSTTLDEHMRQIKISSLFEQCQQQEPLDTTLQDEMQRAKQNLVTANQDISQLIEVIQLEKAGKDYPEFQGIQPSHRPNQGFQDGPITQQLKNLQKKLETKKGQTIGKIESLEEELSKKQAAQRHGQDECENQQRESRKHQATQQQHAFDRLQDSRSKVQNKIQQEQEKIDEKINEINLQENIDILEKSRYLHKVITNKNEGGDIAFIIYSLLVVLFILVDTLPIILKLSSPRGVYDSKVDREESEAMSHEDPAYGKKQRSNDIRAYVTLRKDTAAHVWDTVSKEDKKRDGHEEQEVHKQRKINQTAFMQSFNQDCANQDKEFFAKRRESDTSDTGVDFS